MHKHHSKNSAYTTYMLHNVYGICLKDQSITIILSNLFSASLNILVQCISFSISQRISSVQCSGISSVQCIGMSPLQCIGISSVLCIGISSVQCIGISSIQCYNFVIFSFSATRISPRTMEKSRRIEQNQAEYKNYTIFYLLHLGQKIRLSTLMFWRIGQKSGLFSD